MVLFIARADRLLALDWTIEGSECSIDGFLHEFTAPNCPCLQLYLVVSPRLVTVMPAYTAAQSMEIRSFEH